MAAATGDLENQFCTLCEEENINNLALSLCSECETFLCSDCEKHHRRNKASKEHITIPVKDYKEFCTFRTSTSPQCKEHGKRFDFYCSFHQVACCVECIIGNHKKCNKIRELGEVLKGFKASSSVSLLDDDLQNLRENFDKVTKYLSSKLDDIDTQKTKGIEKIKSMRTSINDHLDKLEQKLLDELDDKHMEIKSSIENLQKEIENKKSQTDQLETDFNNMKKFATELQMFVGMKEFGKMTDELLDFSTGSTREDLEKKTNMEIELFSEILKNESFGKLNISSVPVSLQLTVRKEQQAQLQVQNPVKSSQIKAKLLRNISIGKNVSITGCQILPTGQMLFVDGRGKRLMLFNEDGSFVRVVVAFARKPYDVTYIKESTVAVTTFNDRKVHFVDFDRNVILKSKNISQNCFGIDSDGKVIRINSGFNQCIVNLSIDGKSEFLSKILPSESSDIATFGEHIYITEYNDNRVKCLLKNGDVLWTYQLTEGKHPRGLSVDKHGFVYVACSASDNVVVMPTKGNKGCIILTHDDGILDPFALNINRNTSKLLVANLDNGEAFLYQI